MSKSQLYNTQHNPADIEAEKTLEPHEYYNLYVRKEGEKVLSAEEFKDPGNRHKLNETYEKSQKDYQLLMKKMLDFYG